MFLSLKVKLPTISRINLDKTANRSATVLHPNCSHVLFSDSWQPRNIKIPIIVHVGKVKNDLKRLVFSINITLWPHFGLPVF